MNEERIRSMTERLQQALAPEHLDIEDDSAAHAGHAGARSGAGHFNLTIVARAFSGQAPLARHRMVYRALADMMPAEIHALSIRAYSPEEL